MNPFAWIERGVRDPGWMGIAFRVPLCLAMVAAVYWLRDGVLWLNVNVLHSDSVVPSAGKHHGIVVIFRWFGAFWLALEAVLAIRLLYRRKRDQRGSEQSAP
jgi:hypothetical protein